MSAVAEALEVSRVDSHLHPEGSFEIDDHAVPTGREEIWRFTPLKRLRGLHNDAPLDGSAVDATYDLPERCRRRGARQRTTPGSGRAASCPPTGSPPGCGTRPAGASR